MGWSPCRDESDATWKKSESRRREIGEDSSLLMGNGRGRLRRWSWEAQSGVFAEREGGRDAFLHVGRLLLLVHRCRVGEDNEDHSLSLRCNRRGHLQMGNPESGCDRDGRRSLLESIATLEVLRSEGLKRGVADQTTQ